MKKIAFCLLLCWMAVQIRAAEGQWLTDLGKARAEATAAKKPVMLDFTGSDWCPPCKALYKNVFSAPEFQEYAKKNLVLVEVDFPRSKPQPQELTKANQALAAKLKVKAYPTIVLQNSEGEELGREVGYSGASPKEFIARLEKWKRQL